MTEREALKLALEALEKYAHDFGSSDLSVKAMYVARNALAQPEQGPVAKVVSTAPERIWLDLGFDPSDEDEISFDDLIDATWSHDNATGYGIEYVRADAIPPQRPSRSDIKPLTNEEIKPLCAENHIIFGAYTLDFIRAIEAAHGIKGEA